MAMGRLIIATAALVVLAVGTSAARHPDAETGRGLKQSVEVSAASPAVSLDVSAGPFSGFLTRVASFLQNDARTLRANVASTASTINSTVVENPIVATFETNLASGLEAAQHNLNTALQNGQAAGQGAMENLNTILSNLLSGGNSILHDVEAALPPVPTLPAGLQLPIIGEPMTTVQTSG